MEAGTSSRTPVVVLVEVSAFMVPAINAPVVVALPVMALPAVVLLVVFLLVVVLVKATLVMAPMVVVPSVVALPAVGVSVLVLCECWPRPPAVLGETRNNQNQRRGMWKRQRGDLGTGGEEDGAPMPRWLP